MNHLIIYCECLKNKVEILAIEPSFLRVSNSIDFKFSRTQVQRGVTPVRFITQSQKSQDEKIISE